MKFLIFLAVCLAVATAQQYADQTYDIQYKSPQVNVGIKNRQPKTMQQQSRDLFGFPRNIPQNIPVGYSEPQQSSGGCKNNEHNPLAAQAQYRNQYQQPSTPYNLPPSNQNQQQVYQQQIPNNQQYSNLGYSANQQFGQAIEAPASLYEILLPQRNELVEDSTLKQQKLKVATHRYPLTPPSLRFKIGLVADLGKESPTENGTFISYLREGHLIVKQSNKGKQEGDEDENKVTQNVTVEFKDDDGVQLLESGLNDAGEGFELSTLNAFNGKLYTCDDQTGIIYELIRDPETDEVKPMPWVILPTDLENGPRKTFKCEWATVKDNHLWIGSLGIATDKNENEITDKRMIKKVSSEGQITTIDWTANYNKLAKALDVDLKTGFVNHEAAAWSDILQKWIFVPRRVSKKKFDKTTIDKTGSNLAILTDDSFEDIKVLKLGELVESSGFTGVKFIPGCQDLLILALKAGVDGNSTNAVSTLAVYDLEGKEIMKPIEAANGVYAGIEFL